MFPSKNRNNLKISRDLTEALCLKKTDYIFQEKNKEKNNKLFPLVNVKGHTAAEIMIKLDNISLV